MLTPVGLWLALVRLAAAGAGDRTPTLPTAVVDVRLADALVLRAVAVRSRRFSWRLPRGLPALAGGALRLPGGLRLVDVTAGHDDVVVTATLAGPLTMTTTPGRLLRGAFGR